MLRGSFLEVFEGFYRMTGIELDLAAFYAHCAIAPSSPFPPISGHQFSKHSDQPEGHQWALTGFLIREGPWSCFLDADESVAHSSLHWTAVVDTELLTHLSSPTPTPLPSGGLVYRLGRAGRT